jgi:hypothetical protein
MRTLLPCLALIGCAAPDTSAIFTNLDVRVVADEQAAGDEMVAVIEGADDELIVALPHLTDGFLTEAILAKHAEGVDVRVISDIDQASDPGIVALMDAGVPLRLGDAGITYFDFALNVDVSWTSSQVIMSHAFAVADRHDVVSATAVGGDSPGAQVVFQIQGEDVANDLWTEHNQIFGGSDATALTAFSAPAKSIADARWVYPTDTSVPLEMWFGPQERVTKRCIDAIYSARTSVRVMSNELVNDGLVRAMQEKASWGFPVEAIVGPEFGSTSQALARVLENDAPDVTKRRFDAVSDLPTVVLIDIEGGPQVTPRGYVLSHDMYSAARLYRSTTVLTDQLIDGNLFVVSDETYALGSSPDSELQALVDVYLDHLDRSGDF